MFQKLWNVYENMKWKICTVCNKEKINKYVKGWNGVALIVFGFDLYVQIQIRKLLKTYFSFLLDFLGNFLWDL
jgi:hypothetical protein